MKQVLAGLGLLAGAAIGTVAIAPAGADPTGGTWTKLEASWSPNPAEPGAEVALTPAEACNLDEDGDIVAGPGEVLIYLDGATEAISVEMADDGSWEFVTDAPTEPGVYKAVAECRNDVWAEEIEFCEADPDRLPPGVNWNEEEGAFELVSYSKPAAPTWEFFDCAFEYYAADLTVEGPDTPPTTAPPTTPPPPATPIEAPPTHGG